MNNYICVNNQKIALTEEQIAQIVAAQAAGSVKLAEVPVGDTVKIGDHEMVVLHQSGEETSLIRKELLPDCQFGKNNNYDGSYVDEECNAFSDEIASVVGEDNMIRHTVDLTTDDGLKDYGQVQRLASLLTADQYRRFVEVLDMHKPNEWWWLATAHSTERHGNDVWAKCVSPSGDFDLVDFIYDLGVRPFCILKSNIFVSK